MAPSRGKIGAGSLIQYWLRTGAIGSGRPRLTLRRLAQAPAALTTMRATRVLPSASSTPRTVPVSATIPVTSALVQRTPPAMAARSRAVANR